VPDPNSYVLALLRERVGVDQAISAADLAAKATAYYGDAIGEREVRQIVHDLRLEGQPICSSGDGFFWPASLQDVLDTAEREFRSHARSMLMVARRLRQAGNRLFGGQGKLL